VRSFHCLWYETFGQQPVQVVIVHKHTKPGGHELTLVSTDLDATPKQLIERFADRWPIETAYEQAKQLFGAGQARNRTENAVRRTIPFQLLAMTLTSCWYALHGHHPNDAAEHRHRAPWYLTKTTPSFADMLAKLRRVIIANQIHPKSPLSPHTPRNHPGPARLGRRRRMNCETRADGRRQIGGTRAGGDAGSTEAPREQPRPAPHCWPDEGREGVPTETPDAACRSMSAADCRQTIRGLGQQLAAGKADHAPTRAHESTAQHAGADAGRAAICARRSQRDRAAYEANTS
jgi:hypothetical protein